MTNSILKVSSKSNSSFGTCFAVSNDGKGSHFVTCGHVVNSCGENDILIDGKPAKVLINKYNDGIDLAILFVDNLLVEPLQFGESTINSIYHVIGYTTLSQDIIKREKIDNINIKDDIKIESNKTGITLNAIKLYTKEEISSGYSGSPIICSNTKFVIGIVNLKAGKEINYGISNTHLDDFFNITIEKNEVTRKKALTTSLTNEQEYFITRTIDTEFQNCINCYATQNTAWLEPKLYLNKEGATRTSDRGSSVNVKDIVTSPCSLVINASQQYGLTSLAKHMIKEAWNNETRSFWLYLDVNTLKPHKKEIIKHVGKILTSFNLTQQDIECLVIDEVSVSVNNIQKILNVINEVFIDIPIVIMISQPENPLISESIDFEKLRHFDEKYLWSLTRHDIRCIVSNYNKYSKYIDNDEIVINRLISDLEVLNVPRTPLNCLTFLKIYEANFDEAPINRTDMISKVLYLLFNVDEVPKYKTRPDLKDVEYVLGYLCEIIIREHEFCFSRENFLTTIEDFCVDQEINMDTHVIFDVLYTNNILIQRNSGFCFKFSYWVLYFAAHRMHHDDEFYQYIFSNMNYTSYPEIIEYYAGVNRRSNDALIRLKRDIIQTKNTVEAKCQIPDDFNIYEVMLWKPSDTSLESVKDMLAAGAQGSKLPDEIKDSFADKSYDPTRPMSQSVDKILEDYSLLRLMKATQTASKALRNSDYAQPKLRHELLEEIIKSWEQIIKVLILLSPALSRSKRVTIDGASFILCEEFKGDFEDILNRLILLIPINVVGWFENDIFSKKMGSLLYNNAKRHDSQLALHTLALLVASKRPTDWEAFVHEYISHQHKNSYYLCSIFNELRGQYRYSFSDTKELGKMADLIKLSLAKHEGIKNLNQKAIKRVSEKCLPERQEE